MLTKIPNEMLQNSIEFSTQDNAKTITGFKENGVLYPVRSVSVVDGALTVSLAAFTPTVTVNALPSNSLAWDQHVSGMSVVVNNPNDYQSKWIAQAFYMSDNDNEDSGLVTAPQVGSGFSGSSRHPAFGTTWGGDWNETLTLTDTDNGVIHCPPGAYDYEGGSVTVKVSFVDELENIGPANTSDHWPGSTDTFTVTWANPSASITLSPLTGKTFLESYSSTTYTPAITGINNSANRTFTIAGTNGTPSNSSAAGTLNFTENIHKSNASTLNTKVTLATALTRPKPVTGSVVSTSLANVDSASVNTSAAFSYPSFTFFLINHIFLY
jgi:hypothetical protein